MLNCQIGAGNQSGRMVQFLPGTEGSGGLLSPRGYISRATNQSFVARVEVGETGSFIVGETGPFIVGETGPFIFGEIGPFIFLESTSYRSAHQWIEFEPVLKPEFITTSTRDMF